MEIKVLRSPNDYATELEHIQQINENGCRYCKKHDFEIKKIEHPTNWIYNVRCWNCHSIYEFDFGNLVKMAYDNVKIKKWTVDEGKYIEMELFYLEKENAIELALYGMFGDHIDSYDVTEEVLNGEYY